MDNFLRLENRHTGEILRLRRVRVAEGQIVLTIDGSLSPRRSGRRFMCIFINVRRGA